MAAKLLASDAARTDAEAALAAERAARVHCEVADWSGMAPRQLLLETVRQVAGTALQGRGKVGRGTVLPS